MAFARLLAETQGQSKMSKKWLAWLPHALTSPLCNESLVYSRAGSSNDDRPSSEAPASLGRLGHGYGDAARTFFLARTRRDCYHHILT